jgi:hypothetical protein
MNEEELELIIEQTVAIMKTDDGTIKKTEIPIPSELQKTDAEKPIIRKMRAHNLVLPEIDKIHPTNFLYLSERGWAFTTFDNERSEKADRKRLEEDQLRSVIRTNNFVRISGILTLIIAGLTVVYVSKDYYKDASPDLKPLYKQLERTSQILDSMRQVEKGIDSSLRIMAKKDSSGKR